jgi:hypothetical protein
VGALSFVCQCIIGGIAPETAKSNTNVAFSFYIVKQSRLDFPAGQRVFVSFKYIVFYEDSDDD